MSANNELEIIQDTEEWNNNNYQVSLNGLNFDKKKGGGYWCGELEMLRGLDIDWNII